MTTSTYQVKVTESQVVKMITECDEDCSVVINGIRVERKVWSWVVIPATGKCKVCSTVEEVIKFIGGAE